MGEIAEMMLDGLMCEGCGEWMDEAFEDGDGPGYPQRCAACQRDAGSELPIHLPRKHAVAKQHACPDCKKKFRTQQGMQDHRRDVHGGADD